MASYMLKIEKSEDAASLVDRAINAALDAQAESIYFELKQHFLIIRVQWGSRMRMLWRGLRAPEVMAYLKTASGMDASARRVVQQGKFPYLHQGQTIIFPVICKPYISEEKEEPCAKAHGYWAQTPGTHCFCTDRPGRRGLRKISEHNPSAPKA